MVDKQIILRFHGKLKEILDAELATGNVIVETWRGNWPDDHTSFISLQDPFKTPIRRHLDGVIFSNVNDPHYWKAEYHDKSNRQLLVCGFGSPPDFSNL